MRLIARASFTLGGIFQYVNLMRTSSGARAAVVGRIDTIAKAHFQVYGQ